MQVNRATEDIGARRLSTVLEAVLDEVSFEGGPGPFSVHDRRARGAPASLGHFSRTRTCPASSSEFARRAPRPRALLHAPARLRQEGRPPPAPAPDAAPVTNLRLAQRGDRLEIRYTAPRASGGRRPARPTLHDRAPASWTGRATSTKQGRRTSAGESRRGDRTRDGAGRPRAGTVVRLAARALAGGRRLRAAPPWPSSCSPRPRCRATSPRRSCPTASTSPGRGRARHRSRDPSPSPPPSPSGSMLPGPRPPAASPSPSSSPLPSPSTTPSPAGPPPPGVSPSPSPLASPSPSPSPTPPPFPGGFSVYRRGAGGAYALPRPPAPVGDNMLTDDDGATLGGSWCYVVRAVVSPRPPGRERPVRERPAPTGEGRLRAVAARRPLRARPRRRRRAHLEPFARGGPRRVPRVPRATEGSAPQRLAELKSGERQSSTRAPRGAPSIATRSPRSTRPGNESARSAPAEGRPPVRYYRVATEGGPRWARLDGDRLHLLTKAPYAGGDSTG